MSKTEVIDYLGDGAYIEWNGWAFIVYTSDGIERTNQVYLEPEHMLNLMRFVERITNEVKAAQVALRK